MYRSPALGLPPWRAVLDFDPNSDETGLLHKVREVLEKHRVLHRVVKGDYDVHPQPGIHWFFARGLAGRPETESLGLHRLWIKDYKRELGKQLDCLQAALSPTPITVVILWSEPELRQHLRTLLEELNGSLGDLAEIVVVSIDKPSLAEICEEAGVPFVEISLRSLCVGLSGILNSPSEADGERCILPTASGAPLHLETKDRLWLNKDLELTHLGVGADGDDSPSAFRRGAVVSWRDLQLRHDCDRDLTAEIRAQVEDDLRRRQTVRISLYHGPGAGGSAVGRRVLWDIHERYPAALLHKCIARFTASRIAKIASLTESGVLVLVDGEEHAERDIDELYDLLKAQHIPVVLLQVLRRFKSQRAGKRQFWLDAQLSDPEADRFRSAYAAINPAKARDLAELTRQHINRHYAAIDSHKSCRAHRK